MHRLRCSPQAGRVEKSEERGQDAPRKVRNKQQKEVPQHFEFFEVSWLFEVPRFFVKVEEPVLVRQQISQIETGRARLVHLRAA
jgi:hypothetical protein